MGAIYVALSLLPLTAFLIAYAIRRYRLPKLVGCADPAAVRPLRRRTAFALRIVAFGTPAVYVTILQFCHASNEWIYPVLAMVVIPAALADWCDRRFL